MRPDDGRVVSNFIVQALRAQPLSVYGEGSQTRSFCYVSDLISGIVRLLESPDDQGSRSERMGKGSEPASQDIHYPVNIGNPSEFTVIELARRVVEMTGSPSKIEHKPLPVDDPRVRRPDISRAKRLLGWEPKVELAEGLKMTIDYFRTVVSAQQE